MGNKKKGRGWKIALLILAIIIAVIAIAGFSFLNSGKNSEAVKEYEKQITAETEKVTEQRISEIDQITQDVLSSLDIEGNGADGGQAGDNPGTDANNSGTGTSGTSSGTQGGSTAAAANVKSQLTEAQKETIKSELKTKYYGILEQQKQDALGMVNSLLSQAKSDYKAAAAAGKGVSGLIPQYMAKVDTMEASMDSSFNATVSKMEEQFEAFGIDGSEIISDYRAQYKSIKEANRKAFMDKALAAVK